MMGVPKLWLGALFSFAALNTAATPAGRGSYGGLPVAYVALGSLLFFVVATLYERKGKPFYPPVAALVLIVVAVAVRLGPPQEIGTTIAILLMSGQAGLAAKSMMVNAGEPVDVQLKEE